MPAPAPATPAWNGGAPESGGFGREVALPTEKMRPAPAPERFVEPASAPSGSSNEMVVPIRIPRGQKMREISIRIVIEHDEAA
jgi:hypothetical protein